MISSNILSSQKWVLCKWKLKRYLPKFHQGCGERISSMSLSYYHSCLDPLPLPLLTLVCLLSHFPTLFFYFNYIAGPRMLFNSIYSDTNSFWRYCWVAWEYINPGINLSRFHLPSIKIILWINSWSHF